MIYFDNSATTYPKPNCVYEALDYANRNLAFNAGRGQYQKALDVANYVKEARELIASFIKCDPKCVAFLSSATEALNIIINGLRINSGENIYISPFEHNAVIRTLYNLKNKIDFNIYFLPFNKDSWSIDEEKMINQFAINKPKAIFLSSISNATGYKLPYEIILKESKKYEAINVLDCAQSYGILPMVINNIDFIVFAGHKTLYTCFGIAGFINLNNFKLDVTKSGGTGSDSLNHKMPEDYYERYEAGSPNIVAIYGLIKSCEWLKCNNILNHETINTRYLINRLKELKKIKIYLPKDEDILGIVSINVEGYNPNDVAVILDEEFGICVRSGFHCSPHVHEFINSIDCGGTIRISLGAFNTKEDIDALINALSTM